MRYWSKIAVFRVYARQSAGPPVRGRRVRVRVRVRVTGLGLGLVIAVRWWGVGRGLGRERSHLPSKKIFLKTIILIDSERPGSR